MEKGVYKLNPTQEVMKQGSRQTRAEKERHTEDYKGPKDGARPVPADEGHETQTFPHTHPMMQTRHSHPSEHKHADGRKHEDHHHGVLLAKGK